MKITSNDKTPKHTLYKTPVTLLNTPSKPIIQHILSKRPLTDTEKVICQKFGKMSLFMIFMDEIDYSKLLTSELNSTETLL